MEPYKLQLKIGPHEFSAEGPADVVKQDFEMWKVLIQSTQAQIPPAPTVGNNNDTSVVNSITREQLERMFLIDDKRGMVTLRVLPRSQERDADALLLILFGYKLAKQLEEVGVTQLKPSMRQSGCMVDRLDQVASRYVRQGLLNKGGMGKGGRYSLTNSGLERAVSLMRDLLAS